MIRKLMAATLMMSCLFANAQTFQGSQKQISHILANIQSFSKHVMASDYDAIADAYTDDAKIFPNNREIIQGSDQIRDYWVLPEGVSTAYHKITPLEIKIKGKEAYDYGLYEGTTRRKDGSEVSWKGKYVIIWKRVAGDWKMYLDIWNRIAD